MALDSSISSSNGLVTWIPYAVLLDTVLEAREFPGVIWNLDASVADVEASAEEGVETMVSSSSIFVSSTCFVAWLVSVRFLRQVLKSSFSPPLGVTVFEA